MNTMPIVFFFVFSSLNKLPGWSARETSVGTKLEQVCLCAYVFYLLNGYSILNLKFVSYSSLPPSLFDQCHHEKKLFCLILKKHVSCNLI